MLEQNPKLFSSFPRATLADWRKQLDKDLKGESFDNLVWRNENGFDIEPLYAPEHLKHTYEPAFYHTDWDVCIQHGSRDASSLNALFLTYLNRGATSIAMNTHQTDLRVALKNVGLEFIHATFFSRPECIPLLNEFLEEKHDLPKLHISIFPEEVRSASDFDIWVKTIELFRERGFAKTTAVNVLPFHNLSCSASFELALSLSYLTEYLEKRSLGMKAVVVKMGANTDYFVQIAKFRALRRLWEILKREYGVDNQLRLVVETSSANKSIADPHTNLLRSTVESMAAVAGGCNELIVNGYDVHASDQQPAAQRLAINQQLILKEEAYLSKMADIGHGSYYIENLTDQLAIAALDKFRIMEKKGGYFACLENNYVTEVLRQSQQVLADELRTASRVLVGVNKFQDIKSLKKVPLAELERPELKDHLLAQYEMDHLKKLVNA